MSNHGQACASPRRIRVGGAPGQASVELISLMGIFLLIILVFTVLSSNLVFDLGAQKNSNMARDSVQKLAQAADSVYAQGEGASTTVNVNVPPTAVLAGGKSYIGKPPGSPGNGSANIININVGGSDEYALTTAPVSGSFPSKTGSYGMKVTSYGTYVFIGPGLIRVSPSSVFLAGSRGEVSLYPVQITMPGANTTAYVSIGYAPQAGNVEFTIDRTSFNTTGNTTVFLTFQPGAQAGGIYNWVLRVNASGCGPSGGENCPADYITIPVTMEVGVG